MRIVAEIDRELPGLSDCERRQVLEDRLRKQAAVEAQDFVRRHEQAAAERGRRDAARAVARERAERERAATADAEAARHALPCEDCGLSQAAGFCPARTSWRRTDSLVQEAVALAVAVRADITNPTAVEEDPAVRERHPRPAGGDV
ncbi:hypothetical protein AB0M97_30550 [Streptomyces sp. NPDC051207]|uniref:hypothetical protein n=1 Tax=Streptomyces sp. NPDC051207 TaxID=3154641 RepID=UPI003431874C